MIVQVEKFMRKWNMVPEGGRVLVGVSGGADSVCLCLILYELSTKMNFSLATLAVAQNRWLVLFNTGITDFAMIAFYLQKLVLNLDKSKISKNS